MREGSGISPQEGAERGKETERKGRSAKAYLLPEM